MACFTVIGFDFATSIFRETFASLYHVCWRIWDCWLRSAMQSCHPWTQTMLAAMGKNENNHPLFEKMPEREKGKRCFDNVLKSKVFYMQVKSSLKMPQVFFSISQICFEQNWKFRVFLKTPSIAHFKILVMGPVRSSNRRCLLFTFWRNILKCTKGPTTSLWALCFRICSQNIGTWMLPVCRLPCWKSAKMKLCSHRRGD